MISLATLMERSLIHVDVINLLLYPLEPLAKHLEDN